MLFCVAFVALKSAVEGFHFRVGQEAEPWNFIHWFKAFDSVDHEVREQRLLNKGLFDQAVHWFTNDLLGRLSVWSWWLSLQVAM